MRWIIVWIVLFLVIGNLSCRSRRKQGVAIVANQGANQMETLSDKDLLWLDTSEHLSDVVKARPSEGTASGRDGRSKFFKWHLGDNTLTAWVFAKAPSKLPAGRYPGRWVCALNKVSGTDRWICDIVFHLSLNDQDEWLLRPYVAWSEEQPWAVPLLNDRLKPYAVVRRRLSPRPGD